MRWPIPVLLLLSAACSGSDPQPKTCPIGDPSKPMEIEIVHKAVGGGVTTTGEGGGVPLILPPQGGKVMLVGVRAKNVDGCPVNLTAALREQCTGEVVAVEQRPVILDPSPSGWGEPAEPLELNNYSNLPACPRARLLRRIDGEPYELEVVVTDKGGRTASRKIMVVPVCGEPANESLCRCECSREFVQGGTCDHPDGGVHPPGMCPDAG